MKPKKKKPVKRKTTLSKPKKRVVKDSTKKKISEAVSKAISEGRSVPKEKSSKLIKTRYSIKSWYHSPKNNEDVFCDSLAEMYKATLLDNDPQVKRWTKKHGIRIPYAYRGKSHVTIPDFLIEYEDGTVCIEEIKGKVTPKELVKKDITEKYCLLKGYNYKFTTTIDLNIDKGYSEYLKLFNLPTRKRRPRRK